MRFYGEISRIDEEARMVWGYASTTTLAEDGQVIAIEALEDALEEYMRFANIREMHLPSAVGVAREAHVDDKGMYIGAHVVDEDAWTKVKTQVYRGFSIKGPVTKRDALDRKIIRGLKIYEISLVDRPSDPDAVFDVWRAAGVGEDLTDEPSEDTMARKADPTTPAAEPAATDSQAAAASPAAVERAPDADAVTGSDSESGADSAAAADPAVERTAGAEGEDVTEAAAAEAIVEPEPEADQDPVAAAVARAASASEALDAAAAALNPQEAAGLAELPGAEVRRSLGLVSRLGYVLNELAYVIADADFEKQLEGDESTVPDQLREAMRGLATAYKAMSAEEVDELLAAYAVARSIDTSIGLLAITGDDLQRAADVTLTEEQAARLQTIFDGFVARGWSPAAAAVSEAAPTEELQRQVAALTADKDTLMRTVGELTDKVTSFANMVAPSKTAAVVRAVEKTEDAAGAGQAPSPAADLSSEDIKRVLDEMPANERAHLLTRAALARPIPIGR